MTATEAISQIRPDDRVMLGMREPATLVRALVADRPRLNGLRLLVGSTTGGTYYTDPEVIEDFELSASFVGPSLRPASRTGRLRYIPIHLSQLPIAVERGDLPVDVALVQVAPPDDQGYCSLGLSADWSFDVVRHTKLVIAEVNDQMPRPRGKNGIHISGIDLLVAASYLPQAWPAAQIGDIERAIGAQVAAIVPNGATIEVGFGSTSEAILDALKGHQDLGIHTGSITEGIRRLVEAGAVTGRRKSIDPGLIVAATVRGSTDFYAWVAAHPDIRIRPFSYTHDVRVIARIERFVALNTALQIDLTGQVNAEAIGSSPIGGVGGQVDWIRGAQYAPGGVSIHAVASRARGKHSAIVADLGPGAPVTTARSDVHWVVTEYGAVNLRGKSLGDRARALAEIAHPDFRGDLRRVAERW
ncbi:MAG TPA: acetyl-CoA hydrolase/transferase C-terminal domain-containing protein [Dehalococcoidia bacterium]|nr:acetyl-CoA hydrolase/transferase C-terminal domain-containing protein [Dehalococcoidia bacterium]